MASHAQNSPSVSWRALRRQASAVRAACGHAACADPCGGRWATSVPTATHTLHSARDDHLSIPAGDGAGHLRRFLAAEPSSFHSARPDADRSVAGGGATAAVHLLALLDLDTVDGSPATVEAAAPFAGTSVGSGPRAAVFDHSGYRYHGAHSLRPADGGAQELQPEE